MNNILLVEYLLGTLSPDNNKELQALLKSEGVEEKLAIISNQLEKVALSVAPVKPKKLLKESIFAHIEKTGSEKFSGLTNRLANFFQLPLSRIKEILDTTKDVTLPLWDTELIEGAYLHHFDAGGDITDAHCGLVHLNPEVQVTEHQHCGQEQMFVLQGEVTTSDGKTYHVGEIALCKKGTSHSLTAGKDSVCIFAVIAQGGVEFKD
jgi:hypothetical protein